MEIFSNPNLSIIISVVSLILAIIGIYISLKNSNRKSLFCMHFENSQIFNPELLNETELVTAIDGRLKNKGLNKLVVYLSNDSHSVIELSDWSKDFGITFEDEGVEVQDVKFFSTNPNSLINNLSILHNSLSFRVGEFEPEDVVKAELKYISAEPQNGLFNFKLKGHKKRQNNFLSDHTIVEQHAETMYGKSNMVSIFPLIIIVLYLCFYHILLACFNLKTDDIIDFYMTESIPNISLVSLMIMFLASPTIPLIIKIHSSFVPIYRKLKKITDYHEIKVSVPTKSL